MSKSPEDYKVEILDPKEVYTDDEPDVEMDRSKVWKPVYTRILVMTQQGMNSKEIARKTKQGYSTVLNVQKRVDFKKRLAELNGRVTDVVTEEAADAINNTREYLQDVMLECAQEIHRIATGKSKKGDSTRLKAACEVVKLAGLVTKQEIDVETSKRVYSVEELRVTNQVLRESEDIMKRLEGRHSRFFLGRPKDSPTESSHSDTRLREVNDGHQLNAEETLKTEPAS